MQWRHLQRVACDSDDDPYQDRGDIVGEQYMDGLDQYICLVCTYRLITLHVCTSLITINKLVESKN